MSSVSKGQKDRSWAGCGAMRAGLKSSSRSPSPRDQRQSRSPQANTGTTTDEEYLGTFSSPSADYEQTAGSDDADDGDLELDFSPAPVSDEAVRQGQAAAADYSPGSPGSPPSRSATPGSQHSIGSAATRSAHSVATDDGDGSAVRFRQRTRGLLVQVRTKYEAPLTGYCSCS